MKAILRFDLPEDQSDFDAARLGRTALSALWDIDNFCRSRLKHGEPSEEAEAILLAIRAMIPYELLDV
jgi:hypothetical protein